jgi:hypothetical protein
VGDTAGLPAAHIPTNFEIYMKGYWRIMYGGVNVLWWMDLWWLELAGDPRMPHLRHAVKIDSLSADMVIKDPCDAVRELLRCHSTDQSCSTISQR